MCTLWKGWPFRSRFSGLCRNKITIRRIKIVSFNVNSELKSLLSKLMKEYNINISVRHSFCKIFYKNLVMAYLIILSKYFIRPIVPDD